jgi:hypothetical protein
MLRYDTLIEIELRRGLIGDLLLFPPLLSSILRLFLGPASTLLKPSPPSYLTLEGAISTLFKVSRDYSLRLGADLICLFMLFFVKSETIPMLLPPPAI